eukprot:CAMPEP_0194030962 /NCGR_PEP_ID=MMETSP0009_2-20130614/4267_1 /TAXON_ID=210454 /ORGANISM="Grammatophora oceanica, Strain CCMP 410" /LENGTH=153 /DNA_ID=CAMNT_0038671005 /DNA_START=118 /DNA_END=579 /DNA_ORIENTATION=-
MFDVNYVSFLCLAVGLFYLTGIIAHSLYRVDYPFLSTNNTDKTSPIPFAMAVRHYQTRNEGLPYKLVPIFCALMTIGVASHVFLEQSVLSVCILVAVAIPFYYNNAMVVGPALALADKKKTKEQQLALLRSIAKGHLLDLSGLGTAFFIVLYS